MKLHYSYVSLPYFFVLEGFLSLLFLDNESYRVSRLEFENISLTKKGSK